MKIETNKLLPKCLLKTAIKTIEKKISILNRKINSASYETTAFKNLINTFAKSNIEFVEATEDDEINDNITTNNNPQKSQPEVKRKSNIAITENHIRSQNIKIVPGNRTYASMTKYGKKICIIDVSHIKRVERNIFNNSIENGNAYLKSFNGAKGSTS